MASEIELEVNEQSPMLERLISSRNRDLSLFIPMLLGLTNTTITTNPEQESTNPDPETPDTANPREPRGRIILVNPLTQGMVVIEGTSSSLDSLVRGLLSRDGKPPASRASIEAMPCVEISEEDDNECAICLEGWVVGGVAKEMPCKHRFHGVCIDKWLGIHGCCPICRHEMPADGEDLVKKSGGSGGDGEERVREIWVTFPFNRAGNRGTNQTLRSDSYSDSSSTLPRPDHQMEMED
ncbi:Ubiquitin--protein ligase [Bertholletia excelsa]